jgi:hypothetical protein
MSTDTRSHVHALVDRLEPAQLTALETLLRSMLVPVDDEPFTVEDRQAVAEADEWLKYNEPIPLEEVLADVGLTMDDWKRMGETPLPQANGSRDG